jgi:hypothetical protein
MVCKQKKVHHFGFKPTKGWPCKMPVVPRWEADRHTIKENKKALHWLFQLL